MGKNKKIAEATRKSSRITIKKLQPAKKQPSGKPKSKDTATARPGIYDNGSDSDSSGTTEAPTASSGSSATPASSSADKVADDEDEWIHKYVMKKRKKPAPLPVRPMPRMKEEDVLYCHGLNDYQINGFLTKTEFRDVMKGYACVKENAVVLKAGYFRLLLTRDYKHHAMPSSMTRDDWARLNKFRQWGLDLFIFVSREYCVEKFVKKLRGNAPIPTDKEIIDNYSYKAIKDSGGNTIGWEYQPAHTALIRIRGTKFTLFDINRNDKADLENRENSFVEDFFYVIKRHVLPKICRNMSLDLEEIRNGYSIFDCFFPMAVGNSCALFLLFVIEQTVDNFKILDVNWSPSLAQLFFHKVVHHVAGGGDNDFETFTSNNPDWLTVVRPFLFESLLYDLKGGEKIKGGLKGLKTLMNKISKDVEYRIEWKKNKHVKEIL